jgi:hypothetical protein
LHGTPHAPAPLPPLLLLYCTTQCCTLLRTC